jgi:predicted acetyltransferase
MQIRVLVSLHKNLAANGSFATQLWVPTRELSNLGGSCNIRHRFETLTTATGGNIQYLVG